MMKNLKKQKRKFVKEKINNKKINNAFFFFNNLFENTKSK